MSRARNYVTKEYFCHFNGATIWIANNKLIKSMENKTFRCCLAWHFDIKASKNHFSVALLCLSTRWAFFIRTIWRFIQSSRTIPHFIGNRYIFFVCYCTMYRMYIARLISNAWKCGGKKNFRLDDNLMFANIVHSVYSVRYNITLKSSYQMELTLYSQCVNNNSVFYYIKS